MTTERERRCPYLSSLAQRIAARERIAIIIPVRSSSPPTRLSTARFAPACGEPRQTVALAGRTRAVRRNRFVVDQRLETCCAALLAGPADLSASARACRTRLPQHAASAVRRATTVLVSFWPCGLSASGDDADPRFALSSGYTTTAIAPNCSGGSTAEASPAAATAPACPIPLSWRRPAPGSFPAGRRAAPRRRRGHPYSTMPIACSP